MKDFLFKLKTAWNAYKTAGDILAAEKAFEEECKYELAERAKMDFLDAAGNQVTRPPWNECSTLHPPYQDTAKPGDIIYIDNGDLVISKPRVVKRNVTMAKRRKNANKRKTK